MRAWVVRELGGIGAMRLEDVEDAPAPRPGEVMADVAAVGLNYPDLLMLSGGYQYRPPLPFTPGMEGVGVVSAVGEDVSGELLGTRVFLGSRAGLLRERVTMPLATLRTVPDALGDDEAAGFTTGALTAWVALERGRARAGERLLVLGAGGGMGLAAVAVGRHLGMEVIAAASSAAKLEAARAAGAGEAVLVDRAAPELPVGSADIVFDAVGGALVAPAMKALRRGGRYLVIGFVGGIGTVALNRLLLKEIEVVGVRAGEAGRQDPAAGRRHMAAVAALAERGAWRPHVGLRVAMDDAPEAFRAMEGGTLVGKAVVRVGEPGPGAEPNG